MNYNIHVKERAIFVVHSLVTRNTQSGNPAGIEGGLIQGGTFREKFKAENCGTSQDNGVHSQT